MQNYLKSFVSGAMISNLDGNTTMAGMNRGTSSWGKLDSRSQLGVKGARSVNVCLALMERKDREVSSPKL